ncbi:MAG: hypothetical protein V5A32_02835 [Halovenus sp.]
MNTRGQTAYDYLLGVVLLLVTIIAVLALFPQLFGPFVDPVSTDQQKMADSLSAELIETNSTLDNERTLDLNTIDDAYVTQLKNRTGVPEIRNVNITVQDGPGDVIGQGGDRRYGVDPAATTVRQIRLAEAGDCRDGCQLVVRVW